MRSFGPRQRTDADRTRDAVAFICMARPEMVAAMTLDAICARYGVSKRANRDAVAKALERQHGG